MNIHQLTVADTCSTLHTHYRCLHRHTHTHIYIYMHIIYTSPSPSWMQHRLGLVGVLLGTHHRLLHHRNLPWQPEPSCSSPRWQAWDSLASTVHQSQLSHLATAYTLHPANLCLHQSLRQLLHLLASHHQEIQQPTKHALKAQQRRQAPLPHGDFCLQQASLHQCVDLPTSLFVQVCHHHHHRHRHRHLHQSQSHQDQFHTSQAHSTNAPFPSNTCHLRSGFSWHGEVVTQLNERCTWHRSHGEARERRIIRNAVRHLQRFAAHNSLGCETGCSEGESVQPPDTRVPGPAAGNHPVGPVGGRRQNWRNQEGCAGRGHDGGQAASRVFAVIKLLHQSPTDSSSWWRRH